MELRGTARHLALLLAFATAAVSCGQIESPEDGELYDLAETTTTLPAGMPYDVYTQMVRDSGGQELSFPDAESRAEELCVGDIVLDDLDAVDDQAIVLAYCPERVAP